MQLVGSVCVLLVILLLLAFVSTWGTVGIVLSGARLRMIRSEKPGHR